MDISFPLRELFFESKKMDVVIDGNDSTVINGVLLPAEERMMDSLEIANFKLYNIPVGVYRFNPMSHIQDSILQNLGKQEALESFSTSMSVVIGFPVMFLLGKIMIDFENGTLSFPVDSLTGTNKSIEPNLFKDGGTLFTRLFINDIPLTVQVDFGADLYLDIHTSFFERNRDRIPVKSIVGKKPLNIAMLHNAWLDVPYEIPENSILKFNDRVIPSSDDNLIQIYSLPCEEVQETYDGVVGYSFFKNLGKKYCLISRI